MTLGTVAAAFVLFATLAVTASQRIVLAWDSAVFGYIYSGEALPGYRDASPGEGAFDAVLPIGWKLADVRVLGACCVVLLLAAGWSRGARGAAFVILAIAPMAPLSRLLEQSVGRESPYPEAGVGAFPSGHAMVTAAIVCTALALARSPTVRGLLAVGGAAFMIGVGVSIIADGGHWPSDVLGGWLLAVVWVVGAYALVLLPDGSRTPPRAPSARRHRGASARPPAPPDPAAPGAHAP